MDQLTAHGMQVQSIRSFLRVQPVPFVSELRLYLADKLVPVWQATEWLAAAPQPPPFWAFVWPGSQALARYLLDSPHVVVGKRVLDFGAGGGLAAIAAARVGAANVLASDIDPLAAHIQLLNADVNQVTFETITRDVVGSQIGVDVVLAGDVCYEREPSERVVGWLRQLATTGTLVLLADPGRSYAPAIGLEILATYDIPTLHELESVECKRTWLWRVC